MSSGGGKLRPNRVRRLNDKFIHYKRSLLTIKTRLVYSRANPSVLFKFENVPPPAKVDFKNAPLVKIILDRARIYYFTGTEFKKCTRKLDECGRNDRNGVRGRPFKTIRENELNGKRRRRVGRRNYVLF